MTLPTADPWAALEFPLTVQECHRLAHLSQRIYAESFFAANGMPISKTEAQRLSFISFLVYTRRIGEFPMTRRDLGRPRRFVSSDPRRSFQP